MEGEHLHIGPGRLGLGLVVDAANQAGLSPHLVGRPQSEARADTYLLALTGGCRQPLKFSSYSEATNFGQLKLAAREAIVRPVPLLITTAVGSALEHCCELLLSVAEKRPHHDDAPTFFIACENHTGPEYVELAKRLGEHGVECRATMVNRLCPERTAEADGERIVVRADPYAEWLIQSEVEHELLEMIADVDFVHLVPDVGPFSLRKRWLVNGTHLALALFARTVNQPSVRSAARDPERRAQIDELQDDMVAALPPEWADLLGSSTAYARRQLVPMCRTEDDTARILKRLRRAELAPFLEDANRKLGEPARLHVAARGQLADSFGDVFENLHQLLLNIDFYADALSIRKGKVRLCERKDEEAIAAYDDLLDGIVDAPTRNHRREQLVRRLHRHHLVAPG